MRLATVRVPSGTTAVRVEDNYLVNLGVPDVGAVLARPDWADWCATAQGPELPGESADYAPVLPWPGKIICCGLNYRAHAAESGTEAPEFPALFTKFPQTLLGAFDDLVLPPESDQVDWEAELAVVIGRAGRRIAAADAASHVAGFALLNDVSLRDWQRRTTQWLAGKAFEATTPFGPWLVTDGEATGRELICEVDGTAFQRANTRDLVHGAEDLVAYISTIVTLEPGDVIATGTPSGVGARQSPPRFLQPGEVLRTAIDGLGECRNTCVRR